MVTLVKYCSWDCRISQIHLQLPSSSVSFFVLCWPMTMSGTVTDIRCFLYVWLVLIHNMMKLVGRKRRGIIVILRFADQTQLLDFCCHTTTDRRDWETPPEPWAGLRTDTLIQTRKYWSLPKVWRKVNQFDSLASKPPNGSSIIEMCELWPSSDMLTPVMLPQKQKPRQ